MNLISKKYNMQEITDGYKFLTRVNDQYHMVHHIYYKLLETDNFSVLIIKTKQYFHDVKEYWEIKVKKTDNFDADLITIKENVINFIIELETIEEI